MRKFKIAIWIFLLYIIQTVFGGAININGTIPDLLLAFAVIFTFYEWELNTATLIIIICGILAGSEAGRVFPAVVIMTCAAAMAARGFSAKFIPQCIRVISVIAVSSFVLCAFEYFTAYKWITVYALTNSILPHVIYTVVMACVVYPLVKRTLFYVQDKKQLII